jgi:hypothetical protein
MAGPMIKLRGIGSRTTSIHMPVRRDPAPPRLLLCDNHTTHDTYEFRKFCLDHNIHLFVFPGHGPRILQPLDAVVFRPLDRHVSAAVNDWTANHSLYAKINKGKVIPLWEGARKKGVRPSNVKSAWRKVGIHQWSPETVLEDPAAQAFLREQDEHERREQARRLGHP